MDMLYLTIALSAVMWFLIDRFKPMWAEVKGGNYITTIVSAIFAFALVFNFELDILVASKLVADVTIMGKVLTGLTLMSGSSAVSEIIERIKGQPLN